MVYDLRSLTAQQLFRGMSFKQLVTSEYCLQCRGCCRFHLPDSVWSPGLTDEDIRNIQGMAYSGACITADKRIRLVGDRADAGFLCPFLSAESNTCGIYAVRPFECRLYPFVINRRGTKVYLSVDMNCPCAGEMARDSGKGAGTGWDAYIVYLENILNSAPYRNLLERNPHIIQTYTDVVDLRELSR